MDNRIVRRTRSVAAFPRHRSISPLTVTRVRSVPDFSTLDTYKYKVQQYGVLPAERQHRVSSYIRDWNLFDEYWWDRRYYMSPLYWPSNYRYAPRRYYMTDPPYSLWWNYPGLSYYPRGGSYVYDYLDPLYWRRYRDPAYDKTFNWTYKEMEMSRAVDMYKRGTLAFDTLNKYFLAPSYWDRRFRDFSYSSPGYNHYSYRAPYPYRYYF